jgi:hypothetical protein
MNRFDDHIKWQFIKMLVAPAVSAMLMYVAFRVQLEHRMTVVEIKTEGLRGDVTEIKLAVKELLERIPAKNAER